MNQTVCKIRIVATTGLTTCTTVVSSAAFGMAGSVPFMTSQKPSTCILGLFSYCLSVELCS